MFGSMLWIESKKFFQQPILWIELAVLALLAASMPVLIYAVGQFSPAEVSAEMQAVVIWPNAVIDALSMAGASGLGGMLVVILAGSAITQEYQWRTLHFWISRGVPRGVYLLARFASLLAPALLLALAALLAGGLSSLVITLAVNGTVDMQQINLFQLLPGLLRAAYTLLPYAALALLLGTATRSPAATIGAGVCLALLFEKVLSQVFGLIGGPLAALIEWLPMTMGTVLMSQNVRIAAGQVAEASPISTLSASACAAGIAMYTLIFLGLALWQLKKQDLTG